MVEEIENGFIVIVNLGTAIAIIVVFKELSKTLKNSFGSYYTKQHCFLLCVTTTLVLSCIMRIIFLGIRFYIDVWWKPTKDGIHSRF
jgi:undecaprenyl pyrophosphate phosphatase UppP